MTAAADSADNVVSFGVSRARKLLKDMIDRPFFVIVFDENGHPKGFAKGLDTQATQMVSDVLSAIIKSE